LTESRNPINRAKVKIGRSLDTALELYKLLLEKPWLGHSPKEIAMDLRISYDSANSALKRVRRNWVKMSKLCLECSNYSLIFVDDKITCQECGVEAEHTKSIAQLDTEISAPKLNSLPSKYGEQYLNTLRRQRIFKLSSTINVLLNRKNSLEEKIKSVVAEFSKDRGWPEERTEFTAVTALKHARTNSNCYGRMDRLSLIHNSIMYALVQQQSSNNTITRFIEIWPMLMVQVKRRRSKKKPRMNSDG